MRLLKLPPTNSPIVHLRRLKRTVSDEKLHYKLILLYFGWRKGEGGWKKKKKKRGAIKGMFGALPWCAFDYAHPPTCLFHSSWAEVMIHFYCVAFKRLTTSTHILILIIVQQQLMNIWECIKADLCVKMRLQECVWANAIIISVAVLQYDVSVVLLYKSGQKIIMLLLTCREQWSYGWYRPARTHVSSARK